jgi:hypothetical protein
MPRYFDSQASAAASLGIDIYKIREAKNSGCKAFRSGRVYRDELLQWFGEKREREERRRDADPDDEVVSARDWANRRSVLFDVLEFLHSAYEDKRIDLAKYAELGTATVEQMIKLGEVWDARHRRARLAQSVGAVLEQSYSAKKRCQEARSRLTRLARGGPTYRAARAFAQARLAFWIQAAMSSE